MFLTGSFPWKKTFARQCPGRSLHYPGQRNNNQCHYKETPFPDTLTDEITGKSKFIAGSSSAAGEITPVMNPGKLPGS